MSDTTTTLQTLKESIRAFNQARNWAKYNTPKNLSMALSVEAAELMESFTWLTEAESQEVLKDKTKKTDIAYEIADIAILLLGFCSVAGIDLSATIGQKLAINAKKYPLEG
ncbi:MAG: nucleotide pyrophosphohydrolase [Candidatus Omnitrophica bacterium]|nr:nucleotide pyrophosphohydrolase [Candidatus Omnitrophota bacterium]